MNKLSYPLTMNMKDDAVTDLHAALKVLQLHAPEAEVQEHYYGEGTAAAVRQFQKKHGLAVTGSVGVSGLALRVVRSCPMDRVGGLQ